MKNVINKNKNKVICGKFKHNNEIVDDPKSIADYFIHFFVNVGTNLANKIPESKHRLIYYMPACNNQK